MRKKEFKKKQKVIIFGTGWAFNNFVKVAKDDYKIVAVTDWDYLKHGKKLQGIEVINPYEIDKYEFDYILIASFYVNEIKQQLWDRCKINEEMIIVPPKYQVKQGKPFEDEGTADLARSIIFYLSSLTKSSKINLFLDYGTLLGIARDGDLIKWDDDIDFAINYEDVKKFTLLLIENKNTFPYCDKLIWTVKTKIDKNKTICYYSILFKNKENVIYNEFEIGIRVRRTFEDVSMEMQGRYISCDAIHFEGYDLLDLKGNLLTAPFDHERYLSFVYGNWKEPQELSFGFNEGTLQTPHLDYLKVELTDDLLF